MNNAKPDNPYPKKKTTTWKQGCGCLVAVFVGLIVIGSLADGGKKIETKEKPIPAVQEKPKVRGGFDCLSKWDGSHRKLVDELKRSLRDPDSFKHIETRLAPTKVGGKFLLFMDYRARNGFGGMAVGQLAAIMEKDCSYEIVANVNK